MEELRLGDSNRFSRNKWIIISAMLLVQMVILIFLMITNIEYWLAYLLLIFSISISYGMILNKFEKKNKDDFNLSSIEKTLSLADKTFVYLKDGLDSKSAQFVAQIIKDISNIPAIAITDRKNVLAFVGDGCANNQENYPITSKIILDVMRDGKVRIIRNEDDLDFARSNIDNQLTSAVIIPLYNREEIVGCLKFYETGNRSMTEKDAKSAVGIGKLLSMQLELASYDRQIQLNTEAKLDALQAQINPHFLFNTLNTIKMYINKDTKYARHLIVSLATTLRYLLGKFGRFISLDREISYLEDYIEIEKARYVDRLSIVFVTPEHTENIEVPVLCIQPIVHNAIIHGILPKDGKGEIVINVQRTDDELLVNIEDNGIGMTEVEVINAYKKGYGSGCGIGISNVNERLKLLYGENYGLKIESEYMEGTTVFFKIPII